MKNCSILHGRVFVMKTGLFKGVCVIFLISALECTDFGVPLDRMKGSK